MAKITRKTQQTFGDSAGATGIVEYGSPASGTPVYDTDPDNIQTAAWLSGWAAAALAGTEIPTFQDFNAIHYVTTRQIGYILQEGIPEYDSGTEYHANSIVKKSGTYELYGSIINTNTGNALPSQTDNASWKYLGDLSSLATSSGITTGTAVATTSGTAIDFTGIPSGVKRITVMLNQVSINTTDDLLLRIGDSGGIETTGYVSSGGQTSGAAAATVGSSGGFIIQITDAAETISANITLTNIDGDTWVCSYSGGSGVDLYAVMGGGSKTLTATLDRLRLTSTGSATFDNGSMNIMYES